MKTKILATLLLTTLLIPRLSGTDQIETEDKMTRLWRWSAVAMITSNGLDIASSVGRHETNPVLGTGEFGWRAIGIKSGVVIGSLLLQKLLVHKHPQITRPVAFSNFAVSSAVTGIAVSNFRVRKDR